MAKTLKDKKHAEMIQSWVRNHPNSSYKFEVPFNYFGERGFVDLISDEVNLYSFKTEIVDLGETLRQFNRMKEFYPKYVHAAPIHFTSRLVMLHSPENIGIFSQFKEAFDNIDVTFYDPEHGHKYFGANILMIDQLCHLGVFIEDKGGRGMNFTHEFLKTFATYLAEEIRGNTKEPVYTTIVRAIISKYPKGALVKTEDMARMMGIVGTALNYKGESFEDWWKRFPRSEKQSEKGAELHVPDR